MSLHPITQTTYELIDIFKNLGFNFYNGPEIDTEWKNFDALRVAKDHPARDSQDTFWLPSSYQRKEKSGLMERVLPRTHTSNSQIKCMNENLPPIKIISAGKVFRNEATDATHEAEFHQLEGLYVDQGVSMADLKNTLTYVYKKFFGDDIKVRFRASYFPFVKPGFEVDIYWKNRWLEVCGGGLVHPEVLENAFKDNEKMNKDDIKKYNGFAFGMGLERLVMLKYEIDDIRDMSTGDVRFSRWF
jgi:phenylalanyl-tRNA synthetase alpha chain